MLVENRKVDSSTNVRLTRSDHEELIEIASKVGCKVSQLIRYAIKKHIVAARATFAENPDVWK